MCRQFRPGSLEVAAGPGGVIAGQDLAAVDEGNQEPALRASGRARRPP